MVEKWLLKVQHLMIQSMIDITSQSIEAYKPDTRAKWILSWPGQVIFHIIQLKRSLLRNN